MFKFEYDPAGGGIKNLVVGKAVKSTLGEGVVESEMYGPYFAGRTAAKRGGYVNLSRG